jgi:cupin 2 domain-containing protein
MTLSVCNLLSSQPSAFDAEVSETVVTAQGIRMERIVSLGQASPEGFWYDQKEAEWVMVLTGGARLTIAGESEDRDLGPGDAMYLPVGCRHRVAWTDPTRPTIWLALFVDTRLCPSASGPMETSNIPGSERLR